MCVCWGGGGGCEVHENCWVYLCFFQKILNFGLADRPEIAVAN